MRKVLASCALLVASLFTLGAPAVAASGNYRNPVDIPIPGGGRVKSCADPTVIRSQTAGDDAWYM